MPDSSTGAFSTQSASFTIDVLPRDDAPKVLNASFSVDENVPAGTVVGVIPAIDPDAPLPLSGDIGHYEIIDGDPLGLFAVDATTGEIRTASVLDYEASSSHTLTVAVSDLGTPALTGTGTITIAVDDVLEAPRPLPDALADLDGSEGFVINGYVGSAGDFNGNGHIDLTVDVGFLSVIYGGTGVPPQEVDVSALSGGDGSLGTTLSNAIMATPIGDVNGDDITDLIIKSIWTTQVFGHQGGLGAEYDLRSLLERNGGNGTEGVVLFPGLGSIWTPIGDVNGDGLDDLLSLPGGWSGDSNAFVLFGRADRYPAEIDLGTSGSGFDPSWGLVLDRTELDDRFGYSVSAAGDVNGDGFADIVIGAPLASKGTSQLETETGRSYVVFGGVVASSVVDLGKLDGSNGFRIDGIDRFDRSGTWVSDAGDINGDGFGDLIIGTQPPNGYAKSYVVFGTDDGFGPDFQLDSLLSENGGDGTRGFVLTDEGSSIVGVSSAGDVNGDGYDDLVARVSEGFYVLFGRGSGFAPEFSPLTLLATPDPEIGFAVEGAFAPQPNRFLGTPSGDGIGDYNGDGFDDILFAAPNAEQSYVLFGGDFSLAVDLLGGDASDVLKGTPHADIIVAGPGADLIVGNGGADVLKGGSGDDIIAISDTNFRRVDGGFGVDVLRLDGGFDVDFVEIPDNKISGVESLDLSNGTNNFIILDTLDVLALSDTSNTLNILGDAGDALRLEGNWISAGSVNVDGADLDRFIDGEATVLVAGNPSVTLVANEAPTIDAAVLEIEEKLPAGTVVGNAVAGDANQQTRPLGTISFAITAGNDAGLFAIDSANGEITTSAPLDFAIDTEYQLTVTVTDGGRPPLSDFSSHYRVCDRYAALASYARRR